MTPRELDTATIQANLGVMRELLDDLELVGPVDTDRLERDHLLRYAVERILTQLVDLAVAINSHCAAALLGRGPADYRESFRLMAVGGVLSAELANELAPSVGLRNVLTHQYVALDPAIVVRSVPLALTSYRRYLGAVAQFLLGEGGSTGR